MEVNQTMITETSSKFAYGEPKEAKLTDKQLNEIERKRQEWIDRQYKYFEFADTNTLAYDIKRGEIYEIDWGMNINAEFSGRHFGVVLADSAPNNPLVLICPLKSNHKLKVNPKSDFYLGQVPGLPTESKAVAVLNQIRSIDKIRIYTQLAIGPKKINYRFEEKSGDEPQVYRLDDRKLNQLCVCAARILFGMDPKDPKTM